MTAGPLDLSGLPIAPPPGRFPLKANAPKAQRAVGFGVTPVVVESLVGFTHSGINDFS
jgi:hypothetical protein